jgi:hypothetical protein
MEFDAINIGIPNPPRGYVSNLRLALFLIVSAAVLLVWFSLAALHGIAEQVSLPVIFLVALTLIVILVVENRKRPLDPSETENF